MTAVDAALDLEDLARRYDEQVLREYLLEQDDGQARLQAASDDAADTARALWTEVHDLRPRCFRRLRWLLVVNFFAFWGAVGYCGYACQLRIAEQGLRALPPVEVGLLCVFVLGTQGTVEFAAAACLAGATRSAARALDARSLGFRAWDGAAWLTGLGARSAVFLDVLCLPVMYRGSSLLFLLSLGTFLFAIGLFVAAVQLRLLCGLFCASDQFSYDKPDLLFKGRDAHGMLQGAPISAAQPSSAVQPPTAQPAHPTPLAQLAPHRDEDEPEAVRLDRAPPLNTIKAAGCAYFSDFFMLHAVLTRLYVPVSCQETQEFILSAASFSRCFCEDIVQCSVKFFFLMDCDVNLLVLLSLCVSAGQAVASCFYSSSPIMDIRISEEAET